MFRFTQEPSSGSYKQVLAKIISFVYVCVSVQTLSVLWRYVLTWCACVLFTVQRGTLLVLLCNVFPLKWSVSLAHVDASESIFLPKTTGTAQLVCLKGIDFSLNKKTLSFVDNCDIFSNCFPNRNSASNIAFFKRTC